MIFHPEQFCCRTTQQRNSWPSKCVPVLQDLHVVCVFAIDQYFHLSLCRLYPTLRPWKSFIHRHPFEVFAIISKANMKHHQQSLVNWLQIATVTGKIWKIGRNFTKSYTYTVQYLIVKFALLLALRLEIVCKIFELPGQMKMNFLSTWKIFCSNRSSGIWRSSRSQMPGAWCSSRRLCDSYSILLVRILIDSFSRNQSSTTHRLLLRASRCSERFSDTFTYAGN